MLSFPTNQAPPYVKYDTCQGERIPVVHKNWLMQTHESWSLNFQEFCKPVVKYTIMKY